MRDIVENKLARSYDPRCSIKPTMGPRLPFQYCVRSLVTKTTSRLACTRAQNFCVGR